MKYPLLDRIQAPGDVKLLAETELPRLCEEIRRFLIRSVSSTGGHLSSNLGVVELTVALQRTLDLPQDKLLFDVGHQCYTHKLLTGRRAGFAALQVGTGDSPATVPFYERCGFVRAYRIPGFFTDHYDHPIFEGGVQLTDMVVLRKTLPHQN